MVLVLKGCFNSSRLSYSSKIYKVVLIKYNIAVDINYLNKLDFDVTRMVFDYINISDFYKALRRDGR